MKYVMLAVVATIGAVALFTIAGAFLWAISEELEDIRDLLRIAYADANLDFEAGGLKGESWHQSGLNVVGEGEFGLHPNVGQAFTLRSTPSGEPSGYRGQQTQG